MDHLFKSLTDTGGIQQKDFAPDHIQVKMQNRCQWLIAAKSHDINGLRLQNRGNGGFKGRRIQIVYGILDLFDICAEYGGQDLRLGASAVFGIHFLNAVELSLHAAFQCLLEFRITVITDSRCKTHYGRFTDSQCLTQLCCGHKYCLIVMFRYVIRNGFVAFAHFCIMFVDSGKNIIFCHGS